MVVAFIYLWFTLLVGNFYPLFDGGFQKIWTVIKGQRAVSGVNQQQSDPPGSDTASTDPKHETSEVRVVGA